MSKVYIVMEHRSQSKYSEPVHYESAEDSAAVCCVCASPDKAAEMREALEKNDREMYGDPDDAPEDGYGYSTFEGHYYTICEYEII